LENLINHKKFYDQLKRASEFLSALLIFAVLLPLEALIVHRHENDLPGTGNYKQVRVGEYGRNFILYKFRTMPLDAEKDGAKWAAPGDKRATAFGKFLRHTHLTNFRSS